MSASRQNIYLGTIALEVNRHAAGKRPTIRPSDWVDRILLAGFDGIELWENHVLLGPQEELRALCIAALPVRVFNTYVEFTDDQEPARLRVAELIHQLGAVGVKFNFGAQLDRRDEYIRNVRRFAEQLPPSTQLLCECHAGTIAEGPARAANLLEELGPPERFQAILHTRSEPAVLREWFARLRERVRHLHVFLPSAERRREEIGGIGSFQTLAEVGYDGSFTIEFVDPMNAPGETAAALFDKAVADLQWLRETLAAVFA